jgi:hypothetical protein
MELLKHIQDRKSDHISTMGLMQHIRNRGKNISVFETLINTKKYIKFWIPKIGSNRIRILPYNTDAFCHLFEIHHVRTDEGKYKLKKCLGSSCEYCDTEIKKYDRYYSNIVDLNDIEKGVQVYTYGPRIYNYFQLWHQEGNFTDPVEGYNFIIEREGMGLSSHYIVRRSPQRSRIPISLWGEQLYKLEDILK